MKKTESMLLSRRGKYLLIVSAALTAAVCLVMNLALIPAIERGAGGLRCFDMKGYYSPDYAREFLAAISAEAREIYRFRQLPLDFFYPFAYSVFFIGAFTRLQKKLGAPALLPLLLAAFDYAENICEARLLSADGVIPPAAAAAGGICTAVKTALMYLCFLCLIVFLVRAVIRRRKNAGAVSRP